MSAQPMTYAEVRDFVTSILGPSCEMDDGEMVVFYANCLNQMWADLRDTKFFRASYQFTLLPGQKSIPLPSDIWRIKSISDPVLCTELQEIKPVCQTIETVEPPKAECLPCDTAGKWANTDPKPEPVQTVKPTGFWCDGAAGEYELFFEPLPSGECTFTINGQRYINTVLWDDVISPDGSKVRVWRNVDLPVQFHSIFAKCVVSMSYMACDDPAMGQYWLQLAGNEMEALVNAGDGPGTGKGGGFQMWGDSNDKSSCPSSIKVAPRVMGTDGALVW